MIGYYVHHHGFGHLARAMSIAERMRRPVTVLTSRAVPAANPFSAVVPLPRDDAAARVCEPNAHGALHWAPLLDEGYRARMTTIAQWAHDARPEAFVVDVSVEVATLVRLLGIPLVVMALPGQRVDDPHLLVHRLADRIIAAWPEELSAPDWLRPHRDKTVYVGGISRFERRTPTPGTIGSEPGSATKVLVLGGADGLGIGAEEFRDSTAEVLDSRWTVLGGGRDGWIDDPWPHLCAADLVVTHAGQNCIADVAAARRPAIVIPQPRPFDEQHATAAVLQRFGLATVSPRWPSRTAWSPLLARARTADPQGWRRWRVDGAAQRAADAIAATPRRACR